MPSCKRFPASKSRMTVYGWLLHARLNSEDRFGRPMPASSRAFEIPFSKTAVRKVISG